MNIVDINNKGFLHLRNIFSLRSIELVLKYVTNIQYDYKINFFDKNTKSESYETLGNHLYGNNNTIQKEEKRVVIQLFLENAMIDNTKNRQYDKEDLEYVQNLFKNSYKIVSNLIECSNDLYKVLHTYCMSTVKIYFAKPDCEDQEIHCDAPNEDAIILLIPLIDYDLKMGTTVLFDKNYLERYDKESFFYFDTIGIESKHDFEKAKYDVNFKVGDAILFKSDTFHFGGKNMSNHDRIFLHLVFEKKY